MEIHVDKTDRMVLQKVRLYKGSLLGHFIQTYYYLVVKKSLKDKNRFSEEEKEVMANVVGFFPLLSLGSPDF
jgi:hypothetical protein